MSSGASQPGLSFIGLACYRKDARNGQRFQHRRLPATWIAKLRIARPGGLEVPVQALQIADCLHFNDLGR
jgi:hypothetical protein